MHSGLSSRKLVVLQTNKKIPPALSFGETSGKKEKKKSLWLYGKNP